MDSSEQGFSKMQEEAIRRVMEMQQRSRDAVGNAGTAPLPQSSPGSILGGLKIDEEKALIALLIYILYKQGADIKLLLGLGYLLL